MSTRRRKTKSRRSDRHQQDDQETIKEIQDTEKGFREMLNPIESLIMTIQSVLVWEDPRYTAAMLLVVNILFWLATTMRIYHLVGLTGLVVVFTDMWTSKIWPEIRLPPPANEDTEGWTPVHPRLLSVPEISEYAATYWVNVSRNVRWAWKLRQQSHFKFFLLMVFLNICLGVVGHYTSGIQLLYCSVMGVLLLPAVAYHQLPQKAYALIEPHMLRMEKSFNVKRRKAKRPKRKKDTEGSQDGYSSDTDSDAELKEFIPEAPKTIRMLHQAASDDATAQTTDLLTPDSLSQGPSREQSDTEELSFAQGLSSIPGIDDSTLDNNSDDDELPSRLEVPDLDTSESELDVTVTGDEAAKAGGMEGIKFVDKHFKDSSSDSDLDDLESKMAAGLKIPDVDEVDTGAESAEQYRTGLLGRVTEQVSAAIATEVMSQTMSSLMSSTMSGLTKLGFGQSTTSRMPDAVHYSVDQTGRKVNLQTSDAHMSGLVDSAESVDLFEEFEFLEEYDLEHPEHSPDVRAGSRTDKADDK